MVTPDPLALETSVASVTVKTEPAYGRHPATIELTAAIGWDYDGVDLTPEEARTVARALLAHADALDPPVCPRCSHLVSLHGAVGPARKDGLPYLDPCMCCDGYRPTL